MNKKILVIDDDEGILDALQLMLTGAGYDVEATVNVEYAEKLNKKTNGGLPDLIILDMLLSGKDGREVCKKLKEKKDTKSIPILMISAHPKAQNSVKNVGADDFLQKPFDMYEVLRVIEKKIKKADQ
jgi:DNA-binding response OmpR family regulator